MSEFNKVLKRIEKKIEELQIPLEDEWVFHISPLQEEGLKNLEPIFKKEFDRVWNETNFNHATEEWRRTYSTSKYAVVIQYLF